MITAYCLAYQNWTVVPHQIEESFADMAEMGFDAVCLSFSESEMSYARRAFELQVDLAHRAGLQALVVPSRLGGRFAGAPLMPSMWLATHPEARASDIEGWPVACLENQAFVDWIHGFMETLLTDYDLDGIIWDEPKAIGAVTHHPDTVAKYGPDPTEEQMMDSMVEFIQDLTTHCLSIKDDLSITLFVQKWNQEYFTRRAAHIDGLEFFGYDGNLARQSRFHEEPTWAKYRIESAWERTLAEAEAAEVGTFALVENMLMPAEAVPEFEVNFEAYLQGPLPDHLGIYYYAHNNEDPEAVQSVVRRLMKKHL
jgi:hypothetical protein